MKKIFAYICAFAACFGLHAEHSGGDILKFFDGVKISSFIANAPESLNITSYPQTKKISVIRFFENRGNFAFWTNAYLENEDFPASAACAKEEWFSNANICAWPGYLKFISYIENKKLFLMGCYDNGNMGCFEIAKLSPSGRPALILSENLDKRWRSQLKFKDPAAVSAGDAPPNIVLNAGEIVYNKNTETFSQGYFSESDAKFTGYGLDKKIIGELSDLLVYRSLYARFGKTEPASPPNYLGVSEILRIEESYKNGNLDNEKYLAATKPYRVYKNIMGRLLGEWKSAKGNLSVSTLSNYAYCISRENPEICDITFISFWSSGKKIVRRDLSVSFREEKDFIFGDAKMIVSAARIDQIANNAIYWQRGDADFEKWEISSDFSEIKEYRKDGENWLLQSVMKKVVESANK